MARRPVPPSRSSLRRSVRAAMLAALVGALAAPPSTAAPARAAAPARRAAVDPGLVAAVAAGRPVTALAVLRRQADVSGADRLADKRARGRFVYDRLVETAAVTQAPIRSLLARRGVSYTPYVIVNAVVFEADADARGGRRAGRCATVVSRYETLQSGFLIAASLADIDALARERGVARILPAPNHRLLLANAVPHIGADQVASTLGLDGKDVTIGVIDTGIDYLHAAFGGSGLSGAYTADDHAKVEPGTFPTAKVVGGYDFAGTRYGGSGAPTPDDDPIDENGHGTHVAGIALGRQGSREIGVAPEAQWIACRIFAQDRGTTKAILDCLEWALAPTKRDGSDPRPDRAPDIINASWGTFGRLFCDNPFPAEAAIRNLVAAGVLFVSAAGNDGPRCGSVCPPGSLADAFTVGNYDDERRRMADTSSRGPSTAGGGERIKPDVAAPGENINSSVGTSQYSVMAGTSMAAPHVSGAAALLLSARPSLAGHPSQIRALLESTASALNADQCGPSGARAFNNAAGHGVIDAAAAVDAALGLPTPTAAPPTATATATATAAPVTPTTPAAPTARPSASRTTEPTSTAGPTRTAGASATPGRTPPSATPAATARIFLPNAARGR
ncbi:MAG: S8 family serine peptidase [Anaerolineae bacterium]